MLTDPQKNPHTACNRSARLCYAMQTSANSTPIKPFYRPREGRKNKRFERGCFLANTVHVMLESARSERQIDLKYT